MITKISQKRKEDAERLKSILLDIINIDFNEKYKSQEDKIKKDAVEIVKFMNTTILR